MPPSPQTLAETVQNILVVSARALEEARETVRASGLASPEVNQLAASLNDLITWTRITRAQVYNIVYQPPVDDEDTQPYRPGGW